MERVISIANDYTKTPGGRHVNEGKYSGEDFRETVLRPDSGTVRHFLKKLLVVWPGQPVTKGF